MANNLPPEFLRMFGGVAGNMDTIASTTLQETPDGKYTFSPSTRYFDQVKELHNMAGYNQIQPQYYYPPVQSQQQPQQFTLGYTPAQSQVETNNMDISKYIGKGKPKKEQIIQPNSQVEALKIALKPLNDQLEKVCILLGMIYQAVDKGDAIMEDEEEPQAPYIPEVYGDDSDKTLNEQIAEAEMMLKSRPKAPTTEEIQQGDENQALEI